MSSNVNECKPLRGGRVHRADHEEDTSAQRQRAECLPLHVRQGHTLVHFSVSAFCGIGVACRGCLGGAYEVSGGSRGCLLCILCQKRLRLSLKVDECKPLPSTAFSRQNGSTHSPVDNTTSLLANILGINRSSWYGPVENARHIIRRKFT